MPRIVVIDLTRFERDTLFIVAGLSDPNGLAVNAELEEYYGREINHGQLYQNLNALVEKGLVHKDQKDGRANEYSLSRRGQHELVARREWEDVYVDDILESASA